MLCTSGHRQSDKVDEVAGKNTRVSAHQLHALSVRGELLEGKEHPRDRRRVTRESSGDVQQQPYRSRGDQRLYVVVRAWGRGGGEARETG